MDDLLIERSGEIWSVTLNRPTSANSLSESLVAALCQAIDDFENAGGRTLVLQGQGRHFCSGFDLSGISEATDADLLYRFVGIELLLGRLWAARFATIAIARGRAIGAGADLFAACGRRIAVGRASFAFPGAAFGLVLGTRRLCRRIGNSAAEHLITSGQAMDSKRALACGLATSHVEEGELRAVLDSEIEASMRLDASTFKQIREVARAETHELDWDLAALVRSAARPGLRDRILEFRERSKETRAARAKP